MRLVTPTIPSRRFYRVQIRPGVWTRLTSGDCFTVTSDPKQSTTWTSRKAAWDWAHRHGFTAAIVEEIP